MQATPWWFYNTSAASRPSSETTSATVLGHYENTTLPSLVRVKLANHTAVYSANPALPTQAYLALALAAGVHSYLDANPGGAVSASARVEAGGNMLVIHHPFKANGGSEPPDHAPPPVSELCGVALPWAMTVHAANGSLVCTKCARFRDCGIGRQTRVYTVSQSAPA